VKLLVLAAVVAAVDAGLVGAQPAPATSMPPVTVAVDVAKSPISPNGDGIRDRTRVGVTVGGPATLTVTVVDAAGAPVFVLAGGLPVSAGRVDFFWNGRRAGGGERDGVYTIRARALDDAGAPSEARAQVVVDTERPHVSWRGRWARRVRSAVLPLDLAFTDAASRRLRLSLQLVDQTGTPLARFTPPPKPAGSRRVGWHPSRGLPPGAYRVTVTATDEAGNARTTRPRPYLVERAVSPRTVARFERVGRRVALTFDDCNSPSAWTSLLDTLRARGLKAAFFCPGRQVLAAPSAARRTISDGHTIGSHGWDHSNFASLSFGSALSRLVSDREAWWRLARVSPTPFFRPPYGKYDRTTFAAAGRAGYSKFVLWDVDPSDYAQPGTSVIVSRVLRAVRPGSIVLMHVTWQTASALPTILDGLRSRGLRPVALAELTRQGRPSAAHWPSY
jgi:peptidoglycan/xylan/chitin deacetylase (PgdA/CDA1 family)